MYERRPGICDSEKVLRQAGGLELIDGCLPQDLEAYRMYLEAKECEAVGDTDRALSLYRRMVKMSPVRMNANGWRLSVGCIYRDLQMFSGFDWLRPLLDLIRDLFQSHTIRVLSIAT